ncbi:MAG: hypothetical protein B7Z78_13600 [Rhodospirillales bacterium 20-60-12]|nr:MAG: hypothetical protein B7Z78_13600 [Rhodospirillales bacterium 20-60-12]
MATWGCCAAIMKPIFMRLAGDFTETQRGRFALWLPVAMGAGILFYFDLRAEPPLWCTLALPAAGALVWVSRRAALPRALALLLLAATLGFARADWRTADFPAFDPIPRHAVIAVGRITAVDHLPTGVRVRLDQVTLNDTQRLQRAIRVKLRADDQVAPPIGTIIRVRCLLYGPDRPAYPGAWAYARLQFFDNLTAAGFALGHTEQIGQTPSIHMLALVRRLREAIAGRILAILPLDTGSIAVTLLTGFEQSIPSAERQEFITAGLAHLLAVAGLHVGIIMGLAFGVTRFFCARSERISLFWSGKAIAACAALASGALYAALTGFHLPIMRSLAMAALITLGVLVGRRAVSLRGLGLAAMLVMLLTPDAVPDVSFQMSFSAVLALIAGYERLGAWLRPAAGQGRVWRLGLTIAALAFTSLLAGGASMPFAAYHFHQIQPYYILANVLAVPLTALFVLPLGLLAVAVMPLHLEALALVPMGWGIRLILDVAHLISQWPRAVIVTAPFAGAAAASIGFGLIWLCLWRGRLALWGLIFIGAGALLAASARTPDLVVSPDAQLIALDQGSDILVLRGRKLDHYTLAEWAPLWPAAPLNIVKLTAADPACADGLCSLMTKHGRIEIAAGPDAVALDCGQGAILVSPQPLRGACDAPGVTVIDRFSVYRQGAIAVWLHPFKLLSDQQIQGSRPWVPPWPVWHHWADQSGHS